MPVPAGIVLAGLEPHLLAAILVLAQPEVWLYRVPQLILATQSY